eukprot:TRINITY_DN17954_c0_g1_i1.p1 TRINITY_DN17954_c0_g1~~TRINITY_DN17954_c0_g1_i1.p1  ORF type:complete len:347 (-),score=75.64 TRINITY_DN17954_c0_g1_i1:34-1044(-)
MHCLSCSALLALSLRGAHADGLPETSILQASLAGAGRETVGGASHAAASIGPPGFDSSSSTRYDMSSQRAVGLGARYRLSSFGVGRVVLSDSADAGLHASGRRLEDASSESSAEDPSASAEMAPPPSSSSDASGERDGATHGRESSERSERDSRTHRRRGEEAEASAAEEEDAKTEEEEEEEESGGGHDSDAAASSSQDGAASSSWRSAAGKSESLPAASAAAPKVEEKPAPSDSHESGSHHKTTTPAPGMSFGDVVVLFFTAVFAACLCWLFLRGMWKQESQLASWQKEEEQEGAGDDDEEAGMLDNSRRPRIYGARGDRVRVPCHSEERGGLIE